MIELPETYVLSDQIDASVVGKTIVHAQADASPHAFATYTGDPATYGERLTGRRVTASSPGQLFAGDGCNEIVCEDRILVITTPIRYHAPGAKLPAKHQLLLGFDDGSHMTCTVQMWGGMQCHPYEEGRPQRYQDAVPSPYDAAFDRAYFEGLLSRVKPTLSAKAFLATEQRIPGLGNGVLQDILFNARIHPKRKLKDLSDTLIDDLFRCVKETLLAMRAQGGRDTERDLYGSPGGYDTRLSSKTVQKPCPICGDSLVREAYLGGNIYFCPICQPVA